MTTHFTAPKLIFRLSLVQEPLVTIHSSSNPTVAFLILLLPNRIRRQLESDANIMMVDEPEDQATIESKHIISVVAFVVGTSGLLIQLHPRPMDGVHRGRGDCAPVKRELEEKVGERCRIRHYLARAVAYARLAQVGDDSASSEHPYRYFF
jgi:hypothetical protein